ncbi:23S rRNA (Uracil-5-) -methyltransferase RumA [Sulfitobacter noctilucicola]|uniref:23S rRNA (Uracil1939-C5)-methyltransferase n=1 Tax=Sulfitobacter noctilucicola TaxID=1342301 RepID=A0A7W6M722_9RHOB|nr:RsmD family RNA methyltransferase [Sulfitobacter noctilucicola]KIN62798.1 23S rRNA (Uracil-5-) -methyltransferase RumA [Sulfitobacter noctilucicola]MBB4172671.1 23S rRNA (uracil1939-C5)-methyltransferase [Sulfitobacter noctilucicola]
MSEHKIIRLGHHGDGIAHGPVFAPITLPGEVVTGAVDGQTLKEVRIVTPSDDRVAAPCRHFKSCGGCTLQHASDEFVADWKIGIVRSALEAHGIDTDFRPIVTSPPKSRRRATFAAKRTKKGAMAGFYGRGSDVVIEIPDCQLLLPQLMQGLDVAKELALIGTSRKAALAVTVSVAANGLDVAVTQGKPLDGPLRQGLAELCERLLLARLSWDDEIIGMRKPPVQRFGTAEVLPPPGAFLQATSHGEASLLACVREVVGEAKHVADLFAGCGTFALPLSEKSQVIAVESEPAMIKALDQGWRMAKGLKPLTAVARDLYRRPLLPDEMRALDVVVLDPPRAGAERQVAEIAKSRVPRVAYVSCNSVSFARDAQTLTEAGYTLDWVQVVDQFRWSAHVELAACFSISTERPPELSLTSF